jgi:peptidoglycan hydrolase CwlO-like protein
MSSIESDDPLVSSVSVEDDDDGSLQYVPAELRDLVAEATATLDEAQQSFLSSVQETDIEEDEQDEAQATTAAARSAAAAAAAAAGEEESM